MTKHRWWSVIILLVALGLAYFLFIEQKPGSRFPFKYGLDLVGGTELIYTADTTGISDVTGSMETLKEVVERRVNIFGVSEPLIQIESAGLISGNKTERLIVELPGITDIEQAKAQIGKTPILEFRLLKPESEELLKSDKEVNLNDIFYPAELTGKYVEKAQVLFDPNTRVPTVGLNFNSEGKALFAKITKENLGKPLTIILDGVVKSSPVIQSEITDGKAVITGNFTAEEAKTLVRDLNYGALPIPITLSSSQTIGPSLGEAAFNSGVRAGVIGFIALSIFLILWYRLPGLIAVIALSLYIILSLTLFKLIPVTLTAAGLAGFILSIGMAVDANVLIFERTKEELKKGKSIYDALHEGFTRAWLSIRDSNISSIITALVLFWLGTSAVKGFALTLGVGVLVSMFTAITASRTFLFAIAPKGDSPTKRFLFSNGFHIK